MKIQDILAKLTGQQKNDAGEVVVPTAEELTEFANKLQTREGELTDLANKLSEKEAELTSKETALSTKETALTEKETALTEKETALNEKAKAVDLKGAVIGNVTTPVKPEEKDPSKKILTRAELRALSPREQASFFSDGGKLQD